MNFQEFLALIFKQINSRDDLNNPIITFPIKIAWHLTWTKYCRKISYFENYRLLVTLIPEQLWCFKKDARNIIWQRGWRGKRKNIQIQKILFHTPLVYLFIFGSYFYHDRIWWPFVGRPIMNTIRVNTEWGKFFSEYPRHSSRLWWA